MVTINQAFPLAKLSSAVTEVEPDATAVTSPVLSMVATAVFATVQAAVEVTLAVDISLYVAVAVNCCVEPMAKLAASGVMARDTSVFVATVKAAVPLMPLNKALIVVEP
jgi:hypothetical protein